MAGTIKKLAARFLKIQGDKLVEVARLGTDASGHVVLTHASPIYFSCVELFDGGEDRPRMRMRGKAGLLQPGDGGGLEMFVEMPFPALIFKNIPRSKTDIGPDFICTIAMRFAPALFAVDGSLRVDHYHLEYRTWHPGGGSGDAPPQDEAHYVDANEKPKPLSLKEFTDQSASRSFELDIFGTNASPHFPGADYPLLAACFRNAKNVEFKDRVSIPAHNSGDFNFDKPRAVGLKPVGIRPTAQDTAFGSCCISAIVAIGPKPAPALADLRLDDCFLADDTSFRDDIAVEFIQDVRNDAFLGVGTVKKASRFCWYMRARPVPATVFSAIWNELIARPYLDALRTTDDARDLSFVPFLENIGPVKTGDKLPAFDLLFDVVQQRQEPKESQLSSPVLIGFRPNDADQIEFAADAVFHGLITHDDKMVRRRLKVTVERQRLNQTFEWFDIDRRNPGSRPEIVVTIETDKEIKNDLVGGMVRVGALDLNVPKGASDDNGHIRIRYNVTFDTADPTRADSFGAEQDPKGVAGRARLPRRGEAIPRVASRIDRFDLHGALPGSQDPVPDAGQAFDAVLDELANAPSENDGTPDPRRTQILREKQIASDLQREPPIVFIDGGPAQVTETPFFLHGEEVTRANRNRRLS
ncbi:hypothetical protein CWO91_31155, partial [Bradyrhizobium genosp. SA-3]|uniref:hypothetical protein n=1 Tax=Bradyrhizobium genosp. SA-3 TaxID=508868 RepID=UPI001029AA2B